MYSWSKNWPTLTELFFGKGNGPQGKLNGMTAEKPKAKWTSKRGTGIEDIEEVKNKYPNLINDEFKVKYFDYIDEIIDEILIEST